MRSMCKARRVRRFACPHAFRLVLVCTVLGGCRQMPVAGSIGVVGLQSDLRFTTEAATSLAEELAATGRTVQDMTSTLSRLGATDGEIRQITADPFHSSAFRRVRFVFTCNPADVVGFYTERLPLHGWNLVRRILLSEHSSAGGDWVAVYGKGSALVRVHVYGYAPEGTEGPKNEEHLTIEREVTFDFINATPAELFGRAVYRTGNPKQPGQKPSQ